MRSRQRRVLRGLSAASIAVFTALVAHVFLGGGHVPGLLGIVVPWMLAVPVCVLLAGRSLSFIRLAVAVGAAQMLFHLLFVLGAPSGVSGPVDHHGVPAMGDVALHGSVSGSSPAMLGAHVLAAAVTVAALYFAERGLRIASFAVALVRSWLARVIPGNAPLLPVSRVARPRRVPPASLTSLFLRAPSRRRGPPLLPAL